MSTKELQTKLQELRSLIKKYDVAGLNISLEKDFKFLKIEEVDTLLDVIHKSVELMDQFPNEPKEKKKILINLGK